MTKTNKPLFKPVRAPWESAPDEPAWAEEFDLCSPDPMERAYAQAVLESRKKARRKLAEDAGKNRIENL